MCEGGVVFVRLLVVEVDVKDVFESGVYVIVFLVGVEDSTEFLVFSVVEETVSVVDEVERVTFEDLAVRVCFAFDEEDGGSVVHVDFDEKVFRQCIVIVTAVVAVGVVAVAIIAAIVAAVRQRIIPRRDNL